MKVSTGWIILWIWTFVACIGIWVVQDIWLEQETYTSGQEFDASTNWQIQFSAEAMLEGADSVYFALEQEERIIYGEPAEKPLDYTGRYFLMPPTEVSGKWDIVDGSPTLRFNSNEQTTATLSPTSDEAINTRLIVGSLGFLLWLIITIVGAAIANDDS